MVKKYIFSPKPGFVYVRVRGKYLGRIKAPEGTAEFDQQYWDIRNGKALVGRTSWSALIASYRRSERWSALRQRTQADYEKVLLYIETINGHRDVTKLIRKDVISAQEKNRHRIRFANYIPQVMSVLCERAIDLGWMDDNPAKGVRRIKTPEEKRQPHIPWSDWAVDLWRKKASPLPQLIFEIGIGSVQRPGDWISFHWSDYDGDSLKLRQNKTGEPLLLPCTDHLKAALDGVPTRRGRTILTRPDGKPMNYSYLARIMRNERERLGTLVHDLHALRYRGVIELARAGCDDEEIASYSGHSSKAMIRQYAGAARQNMNAYRAREKRR